MGGENSPKKIIDGINISLQTNKENFFYTIWSARSFRKRNC